MFNYMFNEAREEEAKRFGQLVKTLMAAGRHDDLTKALDDSEYRHKLYLELGLVKEDQPAQADPSALSPGINNA